MIELVKAGDRENPIVVPMLSFEEVAEIMGCPRSAVDELVESGALPVIAIGKRHKRIWTDDLMDYLRSRTGRSSE